MLFDNASLIIDIVNKCNTLLTNKKMHFCGLFIDLKKAFVVVDHDILMYKLEYYDIGCIVGSWDCSYLNKGRQTIKEGPYDSKNEVSSFGVPQGSVLGLPFLYIYRRYNSSNQFRSLMCADDTNLLYHSKELKSKTEVRQIKFCEFSSTLAISETN